MVREVVLLLQLVEPFRREGRRWRQVFLLELLLEGFAVLLYSFTWALVLENVVDPIVISGISITGFEV